MPVDERPLRPTAVTCTGCGVTEEEGMLRLWRHVFPRGALGVKAVALGDGTHDVVAMVERLTQVALREESGRVHGTRTERLLRVNDELGRIGLLQRADAVTGQAGRGVDGGQEMA